MIKLMYKYGDKCEYYKLYDRKADGRRRLKKKDKKCEVRNSKFNHFEG